VAVPTKATRTRANPGTATARSTLRAGPQQSILQSRDDGLSPCTPIFGIYNCKLGVWREVKVARPSGRLPE